jgi:hypothetical protein
MCCRNSMQQKGLTDSDSGADKTALATAIVFHYDPAASRVTCFFDPPRIVSSVSTPACWAK